MIGSGIAGCAVGVDVGVDVGIAVEGRRAGIIARGSVAGLDLKIGGRGYRGWQKR
jgi:hypothetical protein